MDGGYHEPEFKSEGNRTCKSRSGSKWTKLEKCELRRRSEYHNNALNSFLQGQINNLTSSFDLNVGMESTNQEDGTNRTDYNFQFAKRFWNNRFRVVIGGSISTGNNVKQDETFIDNVSLEYRLDDSGTRYVKLFHNKNYESVLEGEIIETGAGIVLRKKVSRLGELFIFRKKRRNNQEAIIEDKKKTLEKDESNKNEN